MKNEKKIIVAIVLISILILTFLIWVVNQSEVKKVKEEIGVGLSLNSDKELISENVEKNKVGNTLLNNISETIQEKKSEPSEAEKEEIIKLIEKLGMEVGIPPKTEIEKRKQREIEELKKKRSILMPAWKRELNLVLSDEIPEDFALANNLPEDPGKLGEKLLLGVDQNANGIPDDLERVIKYNLKEYPALEVLHLASAKNRVQDVQIGLDENFSDEVLRQVDVDVKDYVSCISAYRKKYQGKRYQVSSSNIGNIGKLFYNPNWNRIKYGNNAVGVKSNNFRLNQNPADRYESDGSAETCKAYVERYGLEWKE